MKTDELCPICSTKNSDDSYLPPTIYNERTFKYLDCHNCDSIYLTPSLSKKDLESLYSSEYHDEFYFKCQNNHYSTQLKILKKYTSGKKLLDYGCGDAGFLNSAHKAGFNCIGLEYDRSLIKRLDKEYPDMKFFTPLDFFNEYNGHLEIIHLGDVLEHLNDPRELFESLLSNYCNESCYFFIEGPVENNFNLAWLIRLFYFKLKRLFHNNFKADHEPYHTSFTSSRGQLDFFKSFGLQTIHYEIHEVPWPFIGERKSIKNIRDFIQYIIAKVSIVLSRLVPRWGNRFEYVGRINH